MQNSISYTNDYAVQKYDRRFEIKLNNVDAIFHDHWFQQFQNTSTQNSKIRYQNDSLLTDDQILHETYDEKIKRFTLNLQSL